MLQVNLPDKQNKLLMFEHMEPNPKQNIKQVRPCETFKACSQDQVILSTDLSGSEL